MVRKNKMKTLITFEMDAGILNTLEFTASAECELNGDDIEARHAKITVYIPGLSTSGIHLDVTHLISESELDTIMGKVIEAYWVRKDNKNEPQCLYN